MHAVGMLHIFISIARWSSRASFGVQRLIISNKRIRNQKHRTKPYFIILRITCIELENYAISIERDTCGLIEMLNANKKWIYNSGSDSRRIQDDYSCCYYGFYGIKSFSCCRTEITIKKSLSIHACMHFNMCHQM